MLLIPWRHSVGYWKKKVEIKEDPIQNVFHRVELIHTSTYAASSVALFRGNAEQWNKELI